MTVHAQTVESVAIESPASIALSARVAAPRAARLRRFWPLTLPAVAMLALGLWGIDRGSMFGTEAATYWAAHLPIDTFWRLLSHVDAVHGLYYLMMRGVFALGSTEVVLRIPSVLGACAAAVLLSYLGYRLTGSRIIAVAAGGILVSLVVVNGVAQEGRSYAIDLALVIAASVAFVVAVQHQAAGTGRRWHWIAYGGLLILAGYLHEFTVLAVAAHALTLVWSRADRRSWGRFGIAVGCAAVALIPLVVISRAEDKALSWVQPATPRTFVDLAVNLAGPGVVSVVVAGVLVVIGALPLTRIAVPARSRRLTLVAFALPLLVVPGALLIVESMVSIPLYGGVRYVLYSTAGLALLAAAGVYRLAVLFARTVTSRASRATFPDVTPLRLSRHRAVTVSVVVAVLIGCVFAAGLPLQFSQRTAQGRLQNLSAASAFVAANARPGDDLLFLPQAAGLAQLGYPTAFRGLTNVALAQTPEQSARFYGVDRPTATIVSRIDGSKRLWVLGTMKGSSTGTSREAAERRAIEAGFRRVSERSYTGINVYLYVRG